MRSSVEIASINVAGAKNVPLNKPKQVISLPKPHQEELKTVEYYYVTDLNVTSSSWKHNMLGHVDNENMNYILQVT